MMLFLIKKSWLYIDELMTKKWMIINEAVKRDIVIFENECIIRQTNKQLKSIENLELKIKTQHLY